MSSAPLTPDQLNKALFMNLIMMLGSSAMQALGKLANPMTGKTEKPNLEMAQHTIDMLEMISAKTKNNLDRDEARLLKDTLSSLQMTFVDTEADLAKSPAAPQQENASAPADSPASTPSDSTEPPPTKPTDDQAGPKFRKSYGP